MVLNETLQNPYCNVLMKKQVNTACNNFYILRESLYS
jgi:hypothetical protein